MSITAKELAKQLNLSEAAISMALNNKPGVSTLTRKRVLEAAASAGYDFSRISNTNEAPASNGTLYFVIYRKNGAVVPNSPVYTHTEHGVLVQDVPFFSQLSEGRLWYQKRQLLRLQCLSAVGCYHIYDTFRCQFQRLLPAFLRSHP